MFFGKDPNLPSESLLSFMVSPYTDDKINEQTMTLKEGWKAANEALKRGQVKQKEYYDRMAKDHSFVVGDFALWRDKSRARTKLGKLASKFASPFEIVKIREPNAVLHTKSGEEFVVHLNMLSAVTKELKESGQTVESTRNRPFSPKMCPEVTVPSKVKKHTKYKLRSQLRALLEQSVVPSESEEPKKENVLPDNPL